MRSMSRICGVLAVAALALSTIATTGCVNTRAAYDEAKTLEERAYVVTEHYTAVVQQAADLKNRGVLKGQALAQVREIEQVARPVVSSLGVLVGNLKAAQTAESEVALQRALDSAVLVLADLVRAVKAAAAGGAT